ncbi:hypothetical protein GOBAR_DD19746 [Gossypium barbadense]|nr:hypothetical protein GOBAR_DD19746 [Gossypium barbadense]
MSGTLPTVDFAAGANNLGSTSGIGRATNKVRTRPEYKSTLLGASSEMNNDGFLEEEFTLLDGDAVTEVIEGVPSITFSNRVVIGQTVGPVVKLDVHTDCARKGRFARLSICVDLRKPLVLKWTFVSGLRRLHRWRSQVALDRSWRSQVLKRM